MRSHSLVIEWQSTELTQNTSVVGQRKIRVIDLGKRFWIVDQCVSFPSSYPPNKVTSLEIWVPWWYHLHHAIICQNLKTYIDCARWHENGMVCSGNKILNTIIQRLFRFHISVISLIFYPESCQSCGSETMGLVYRKRKKELDSSPWEKWEIKKNRDLQHAWNQEISQNLLTNWFYRNIVRKMDS